MDVGELISAAQDGVRDDPGWLGSDSYKTLVEEFVVSRAPTAHVAWLASGERSYLQGSTVALERPPPSGGEAVAEKHVLVVLHEVLHLAHSDFSDAAAFRLALSLPPAFRERLGNDLFNHVEDARVAKREHEVAPANDKYVAMLHKLALEQEEAVYERQEGETPWTRTPKRSFPQLRMALVKRLLVGDRGSAMSPLVASVLTECEAAINAGVSASTTNGARQATIEVLDSVFGHWTELIADLRS